MLLDHVKLCCLVECEFCKIDSREEYSSWKRGERKMERRLFVRYSSLTNCSFRITYLQLQINFCNQVVLCNCLIVNFVWSSATIRSSKLRITNDKGIFVEISSNQFIRWIIFLTHLAMSRFLYAISLLISILCMWIFPLLNENQLYHRITCLYIERCSSLITSISNYFSSQSFLFF